MLIMPNQPSDEPKQQPTPQPVRRKVYCRGNPWRRSHIRRKSPTLFIHQTPLPDSLAGAAENLREEVHLMTMSKAMFEFPDEDASPAVYRCLGALVQSGASLGWIWSLEEIVAPDYARRVLHVSRLTSTAAFEEALDVLLRIAAWIELDSDAVAEIQRIAAQIKKPCRLAVTSG